MLDLCEELKLHIGSYLSARDLCSLLAVHRGLHGMVWSSLARHRVRSLGHLLLPSSLTALEAVAANDALRHSVKELWFCPTCTFICPLLDSSGPTLAVKTSADTGIARERNHTAYIAYLRSPALITRLTRIVDAFPNLQNLGLRVSRDESIEILQPSTWHRFTDYNKCHGQAALLTAMQPYESIGCRLHTTPLGTTEYPAQSNAAAFDALLQAASSSTVPIRRLYNVHLDDGDYDLLPTQEMTSSPSTLPMLSWNWLARLQELYLHVTITRGRNHRGGLVNFFAALSDIRVLHLRIERSNNLGDITGPFRRALKAATFPHLEEYMVLGVQWDWSMLREIMLPVPGTLPRLILRAHDFRYRPAATWAPTLAAYAQRHGISVVEVRTVPIVRSDGQHDHYEDHIYEKDQWRIDVVDLVPSI